MTQRIRLVRNDTRPILVVSLTTESTNDPIDISDVGTVVRMRFRRVGTTTLSATLTATKLPGIVLDDGTVETSPPYNVAGKGGRCSFAWTPQALAGDPGDYEGEIELSFADGTVQTVYDIVKFRLRADFLN